MNSERLRIGYQGAIGSFNDQAGEKYLADNGIKNPEKHYLYTSQKVFRALAEGKIDQGVVAVRNEVGGIVDETAQAMEEYAGTFEQIAEFDILIAHALITRADVPLENITTIMTHEQVLKQCKKTLKQRYSHLRQVSGDGDLADHALVAEHLTRGLDEPLPSRGDVFYPRHTATMGSRILAEKNKGLIVIEDNLQDLGPDNLTRFAVVQKPWSQFYTPAQSGRPGGGQ